MKHWGAGVFALGVFAVSSLSGGCVDGFAIGIEALGEDLRGPSASDGEMEGDASTPSLDDAGNPMVEPGMGGDSMPMQVCVVETGAPSGMGQVVMPDARCYEGCANDMDCAAGERCAVFDSSIACPSGAPCQSDADCPMGLVCYGVNPDATPEENALRMTACLTPPMPCMVDAACPDGFVCNGDTATCELPPMMPEMRACMTDAECGLGAECDLATGLCAATE